MAIMRSITGTLYIVFFEAHHKNVKEDYQWPKNVSSFCAGNKVYADIYWGSGASNMSKNY